MKATGIVRRIDDLGRVVIPKEIRRTMRIREGDPLEIYTDADGEVIFKKYSPMGELSEFTAQYADVLYRATDLPVIITDRDHVITAVGLPKREAADKRITKELEDIMENRAEFVCGSGKELIPIEGLQRSAAAAFPIVGSGDVTGAVIFLRTGSVSAPTDTEIKIARVAANFLGKQTEE
ncbi:MAG: AbrB/MazE/SpoVT family DNA-binding domain-containing protein [Clostridia bacterium]|nr:AbrB/MazE/SpoVT family DNA-binding domain-containing protein [Clostridia bacterium]